MASRPGRTRIDHAPVGPAARTGCVPSRDVNAAMRAASHPARGRRNPCAGEKRRAAL